MFFLSYNSNPLHVIFNVLFQIEYLHLKYQLLANLEAPDQRQFYSCVINFHGGNMPTTIKKAAPMDDSEEPLCFTKIKYPQIKVSLSKHGGFPGGSVAKNPPAHAGDSALTP